MRSWLESHGWDVMFTYTDAITLVAAATLGVVHHGLLMPLAAEWGWPL